MGLSLLRPPTSRAPASDGSPSGMARPGESLMGFDLEHPSDGAEAQAFQGAHRPYEQLRQHALVLQRVLWVSWKEVSHTTPCFAATLYLGMAVGAAVLPPIPAHRRTHGRDSTAAVCQSRAGVFT